MYYPESERREFEKRKCANYHPKGVMPLGDCLISRMQEPENPHMISVVNELSLVGKVTCIWLVKSTHWLYHAYLRSCPLSLVEI